MQERHSNRERYFKEQHLVTEKYIIPYINQVFQIGPTMTVAEIGCGEAGNLKPFLDLGCKFLELILLHTKLKMQSIFIRIILSRRI